jgi:hypothetical protein
MTLDLSDTHGLVCLLPHCVRPESIEQQMSVRFRVSPPCHWGACTAICGEQATPPFSKICTLLVL